ncbi:MAG: 6,7-dimethyl-8-ribityllumazine synthase [Phycisphaeraceae bacterium]|nr:6,7-dimethyl-8-ribityllumazine synthase [Phycisphaeraceae bacterium]
MDTARNSLGPRIAVVVSRYNATVTERLVDGALAAFGRRFPRDVPPPVVVEAPGAFELVVLARRLAGDFSGVVALGCVIRGETEHDRHIASAVANGLAAISVETGVPVTFGVLTVETSEQALERSGGSKGNKGADAMDALLDVLEVLQQLGAGSGGARIGAGRVPGDKGGGA